MSGKKKSPEVEKDFLDVYQNIPDIESIDRKLKRQKMQMQLGILAIVLAIVGGVWYQQHSAQAKQTHLGGNIIRMVANTGGQPVEELQVATPWVNASIVDMMLFRSMFITDASYTEVNPALAEKYEVQDNGLTYVVTMRDNQFWSDGEEITAEDVVFSFHGFMSCEYVNSYLSSAFTNIVGAIDYAEGKADHITGISTEGNVVTIKLETASSNFALMLTQFVPLPQHILKDTELSSLTDRHPFFTNNNGVYSGEFIVEGFNDHLDLVLVKNPYYTDTSTEIEQVILCWDYENTELDYYATNDLTKMVSYRSMKGYTEHEIEVYYYRYFIFNLAGGTTGSENTAMLDARVRQAILHAIDVESLMDEVYLNKATRYYGGAVQLAEPFCEYDPAKAKQLLEEAGYDFNRTFTIGYYSSDSNSRIFLERIASMLEDIGMTVELMKDGAAALYADGKVDMVMKNLSAFNTEDWYGEYLSTNSVINQILGKDGEFDDLIAQLKTTSDMVRYNQILQELVDLEQELLYKVPMFLLTEAIYINANRLSVPDDIIFGNTRYRSDIRMSEWYVKKG